MARYSKPLLSVCIPTYGRPMYTLETLKSIAPQMTKEIELVIVDDDSGDGTFDIVSLFQKANPKLNIRVEQNKKNLGFDNNVLKVMGKGKGKYLWLFGNDDIINPGAIKKILKVIKAKKNISLIHVNYSRYDDLLKKITAKKMVSGISRDIYFDNFEDFYFKKTSDSYFKYLGTNTITMSTDIVSRKEWNKAAKNLSEYSKHNFIHSFVIATAIKNNHNIVYIAKPIVQYRANNHRVWPNDIWKDYNNVLLNYLSSIGYSKNKINDMKKKQKIYEQTESAMKSPILGIAYKYGKPVLYTLRYFRNQLKNA